MTPADDIYVAILKALIPGAVIAVVTASITVWLSVRQFRYQKLWELKYQTYKNILDALATFVRIIPKLVSHYTGGPDLSPKEVSNLVDELVAAEGSLDSAIAIASLIIEQPAITHLRQLHCCIDKDTKDIWAKLDANDAGDALFPDTMLTILGATNGTIQSVIAAGRRELKMRELRTEAVIQSQSADRNPD